MAKNSEQVGVSVNNIGVSTKITGDVDTKGDIRIDGHLVGNIKSTGRIVLGKTGVIEGNVKSKNIEISGEVRGNVVADESLTFKSKSKIQGDITTNIFIVEPDAVFTGKCQMLKDGMTGGSKDLKK